jgi:nitroimidazol reductase NimA-like FMN-containing flavoprotein (pyridoxamine 5'-phosphate oxidase superfamily)
MPSTARFDALSDSESFALLCSVPVGRLIFTEAALPAVRPVTFTVVDGEVVVRTGTDSWVGRLDRCVVAFEVDDLDHDAHTGWSVVVLGQARLVTDTDERYPRTATTRRLWVPGQRDRFLSIPIERITGRRLSRTVGVARHDAR